MASTYVNNLRLNEMGTGDASGTWGTTTNTNLELIGEALGFGTEAITTNADTHSTVVADGASDAGRAMYLKYTGTLDSACTITITPNTMKRMQFIENGTSGSQNIIISQGSGANVTIPPGDTKAVYLDGAGSGAAVVDAFASLSVVDLKVQDDLTITDDLTFSSDSAVVTFGADGDTTLTHTDGTGLTLNSTNKLCFNDASQFVQGSSATVLSLGATDEIDLTATAIDINGTLDVSGQATFADGSAGAPSISNTGDVNAGLFFSAADTMSFSAGGTAQFTMADGSISPVTDNDIDLGTASLKYKSFFAGLVDSENFKVNGGQGSDGQVLTSTGSGVAWEDAAGGASSINDLSDAKTFGTSSIMLGDATTGTIDAANYNTGLGIDVFASLTSGDENTTIGWASLDALTTGSKNTAVGAASLTDHSTGDSNTAVGHQSLANNTTADNNVGIGANALLTNTTGHSNTAVGTQALQANLDDSHQVAIGFQALLAEATSGSNVAVGSLALTTSNGGSNNVAVGKQALTSSTTADHNVAVGSNALAAITDGHSNVAVGYLAASTLATGAVYQTRNNVAVGREALENQATQEDNVCVGYQALGTGNSASNSQITAIGSQTANASHAAYGGTYVGYQAGNIVTSGVHNTAVGRQAGSVTTTGANNFFAGYQAGTSSSPGHVVGGSNHIVLGNSSITNALIKVDWTVTSDSRDKTDVTDLDLGLNFVNSLAPKKYKWDMRSDYSDDLSVTPNGDKKKPQLVTGLLAQDVETLERAAGYKVEEQTNLVVSKDEKGNYGLTYAKLIPILIKALQEADDKIDALTARVTTLEG